MSDRIIKSEKVLSLREIEDRKRDLDNAYKMYDDAKNHISIAINNLKISIDEYEKLYCQCKKSPSNRYAFVSDKLKAKSTKYAIMRVQKILMNTMEEIIRTRHRMEDVLNNDVMNPELLK